CRRIARFSRRCRHPKRNRSHHLHRALARFFRFPRPQAPGPYSIASRAHHRTRTSIAMILRFTRDNNGGVLVEATIMITIMFVFVLGSIDFLFAFYQWNAATKAVQVGVRIAAVSDPVAKCLNGLITKLVSPSRPRGGAMPSFRVPCDGGTATCTGGGTCKGLGGYTATAMRTLVFGRGSTACGDATSYYPAGMCAIFSKITPANVRI